MVRRGLSVARQALVWAALTALAGLTIASCERERDMPESMQLADTMAVVEAMHDDSARDALLDTMPGGEMARGDSAAEMRLLKEKM